MPVLSPAQLDVLVALCDTTFPSVQRPDAFWQRKASDLGVHTALAALIEGLPATQVAGIGALLDVLWPLPSLPLETREGMLATVAASGPEAAGGIALLRRLTIFLAYGVVDPGTGQNPNWSALGYPGPPVVSTPQEPRVPLTLAPDADVPTDADVVVVGSGAGGSVIAAELARAGATVVVLEAGGHFDETTFQPTELGAYRDLYWRGGPAPTADLNVTLLAGSTVGGGTTVNWNTCLPTPAGVREEWAHEHGLKDITEPAFDDHLAAVQERLSVNPSSSTPNIPHDLIAAGAANLGLSYTPVERNWTDGSHDPAVLAATGFGDRSGGKQSADRTYLADAVAAGAVVVERCAVQQVLTENARAIGVEALRTKPDGTQVSVTVRAPRVVIAAGALESPALLLRSGLGGPAVGRSLHVHPSIPVVGDYGRDVRAWEGAPQAGVVDQFQGDYGFLIELIHYSPSMSSSAMPLVSGEQHKETMLAFQNCVPSVVLTRDRSSGQVVVDSDGQPVVTYAVNDPEDLKTIQHGIETSVRIHVAAGARRVIGIADGAPTWHEGEDIDAYLQTLSDLPVGAGGWTIVAAHQMGTCRMGTDPTTSVADPRGQLHDTEGVWIGDSSALPTAVGVNPMITIMALARRTAQFIIDDAPAFGLHRLEEEGRTTRGRSARDGLDRAPLG